jgi:hypothetical protein
MRVSHKGPSVMQNNRQKLGYLGKRILIAFCVSLAVSLILTMLIAVPFVGVIPYLLAIPLHAIWPELSSTGELVEYGFLWVTIKQDWLWPVFFAYFFVITFLPPCIVFFIAYRLRLRRGLD